MARTKIEHVCAECGTQHPKWAGQCAGCGAWNSLVEELASGRELPVIGPAASPRSIDRRHRPVDQPAQPHRHRRARPRARRWHRARLGHAAGRRTRHRQEHPAAAVAGMVAGARRCTSPPRRVPSRCGCEPSDSVRCGPTCGCWPRRRWPTSSPPSTRSSRRSSSSTRSRPCTSRRSARRQGRSSRCAAAPTSWSPSPSSATCRSCSSGMSPRRARWPGRGCSSTSSTPCWRSRENVTMRCGCCGPPSTASAPPMSSACSRWPAMA